MFNSLAGRSPHEDAQPSASPHRRIRKRLGAVLAIASALAMGLTMMTAPQAAQAQTSIQGQWTVVHGGTGLITINIDDTYTSTCKINPNYKDAWCPTPSGTLRYGSGFVDFNGDDGSSTSYRVSGLVSSPDTITSYFGSRTNSPLVMKKGISFVCTDWSVRLGVNPLVEYDPATGNYYLTGSHQLVTTDAAAETAPNYFQSGLCSDFPTPPAPPTILIDSAIDASVPAEAGFWLPQAIVAIKDAAGVPVAGATANGVFRQWLRAELRHRSGRHVHGQRPIHCPGFHRVLQHVLPRDMAHQGRDAVGRTRRVRRPPQAHDTHSHAHTGANDSSHRGSGQCHHRRFITVEVATQGDRQGLELDGQSRRRCERQWNI